MARRATTIKAVRANAEHSVLLLDAGSALFGQSLAQASEGKVIVDAMNLLGYDAMVAGRADLSRGMETFLARVAEARFPILACNLAAKDGKLLLPPYTILERDGVRYGILGVTDLETGKGPGVVQVADVLDPVESARKHLAEMKPQCDVAIVLSRLGWQEDESLAEALPGISVIVGGKSRSVMDKPVIANQTVIVQMGYDGEWIGRLDVSLDSEGHHCESTLSSIALGPDVASDPELVAFLDQYYSRYPNVARPAQH